MNIHYDGPYELRQDLYTDAVVRRGRLEGFYWTRAGRTHKETHIRTNRNTTDALIDAQTETQINTDAETDAQIDAPISLFDELFTMCYRT